MIKVDIDQTLNNPRNLRFLAWFTQTISPKTARGILSSWKFLRRLLHVVDKPERSLVSNYEEIFAGKYTKQELRKIASECFYLRSLALYDFYHYRDDIPALRKRIQILPGAQALFDYLHTSGRGAIAIAPHFVGTDILGIELAQRSSNMQLISIANPTQSYQLDNQTRENYGTRVTPASMMALRDAAQTLKAGGLVATGIDRAFPEEHYPVQFFGKPAYLPTFYIRLALHYEVPILHFVCTRDRAGNYLIDGTDPIWLKKYPSLQEEVIENSKQIIALTESAIQAHPEQWSMFHPLWADQFQQEEVPHAE